MPALGRIRDGQKAPAADGGRYKGNPRGRRKAAPTLDGGPPEGGRYGRKCGLEAGRVLGDYVEGALEGEAGAAEGAFFEEAAD